MSLSISVSFGLLTIWKFDRKLEKCAKSTVLLTDFVVLSNGSSGYYFNLNFFLLTFLKIQSSWDVAVHCHCLLSHILLPSISHKSLNDKEDTYYLILQSSYYKPCDSQKSLRRTFSFQWWEECLHLSLFTVPVFQNLTGFSFCTRNVHTLSEIMLNHCFCPRLYLSG